MFCKLFLWSCMVPDVSDTAWIFRDTHHVLLCCGAAGGPEEWSLLGLGERLQAQSLL